MKMAENTGRWKRYTFYENWTSRWVQEIVFMDAPDGADIEVHTPYYQLYFHFQDGGLAYSFGGHHTGKTFDYTLEPELAELVFNSLEKQGILKKFYEAAGRSSKKSEEKAA